MFGRKQGKIDKSINSTAEKSKDKRESKRDAKKKIKRLRSAQNVIQYNEMLQNGICVLDEDVYSKSVKFEDINYRIATDDVKDNILRNYTSFLNSLGNNVDMSLVINNRLLNKEEFERNIMMQFKSDGLDSIRSEMNQHLMENMAKGNNSVVSDKMFVFSVQDDNYLNAEKDLLNLEKDFIKQLKNLGCEAQSMNGLDRMRELHSITKPGEKFERTYEDLRPDASTKDWITPYSFHFYKEHFEMGDRYCTALTILDYPTWMGDDLIHELCNLECNLVITIHMKALSKDEALDKINKKEMMTTSQIKSELDRRHQRGDFTDTISLKLEEQANSVKDWKEAISEGNERMFRTQMVILVNASSLDEMNAIKKDVLRVGKRCSLSFATMEYEQEMGFNAVLPLGIPLKGLYHNLASSNLAYHVPFTSKELLEEDHPVFYGINQTTNNMILANRMQLKNRNGFVIGSTGSGKSFVVKKEITSILLNDEKSDIIIIDPQGEYKELKDTLNSISGRKICDELTVNAGSNIYFNPFEIDVQQESYLKDKAEFVQMIMAEMIGNGYLTPEQLSIIDRVVLEMYRNYEEKLHAGNLAEAYMPTLTVFYDELGKIDNPVAKQMHTALWIYVHGTYNLFAHESNVDTNSRVLIYNVKDLGDTIKRLGYKVILESIKNKVFENYEKGRRTWVYIDEIYQLLQDKYSENFFYQFFKYVRKFNAAATGITQDSIDLLRTPDSASFLQNSRFYILLSSEPNDLLQMKALLNLSEEQYRYVQTAPTGGGLIRYGNTIIPFADEYPKDTIGYRMWNTDPDKNEKKDNHLHELQKKARKVQETQREMRIEREQKQMERNESILRSTQHTESSEAIEQPRPVASPEVIQEPVSPIHPEKEGQTEEQTSIPQSNPSLDIRSRYTFDPDEY